MTNLLNKLETLKGRAIKTGNFAPLEKFFESDEARGLSYVEKNRGFITSSKIKEFRRCQFCYSKRYIEELPDRLDDADELEKDYFVIGQALDDRLTYGEDYYQDKYEVVPRRSKDAVKSQLTNSSGLLVDNMFSEFKEQSMFNQNPKKRVFITQFGSALIKVELDDLDEEREMIWDVKSISDIKKIRPTDYITQATLYQFMVEEKLGKRFGVEFEFVDKHKGFSRSQALRFTDDAMRVELGRIMQTIDEMIVTHESGFYTEPTDQEVLFDCPYYGVEGHGRPTKPLEY